METTYDILLTRRFIVDMDKDGWENTIVCGKCEELIPKVPNEKVDLVVTSPPYNVNLGKNKFNKNSYASYGDNMPHDKYIEWLKSIFGLIKPKMVQGGRVCINIGDGKNGSIPTHSDIIQFMTKDLKYLLKTTIIWDKNQIGNRTAWGTFQSPRNPSFPTPFEYILVFCNGSQSKDGDKEDITVTKEDFIQNSLAIWKFNPESSMNKKYKHPAMFPIKIPYRLIQQLSYRGDLVFDPFSGMGTTCLAAAMSGRRWLGFELDELYAKRSVDRIESALNFWQITEINSLEDTPE